jgi:hypothetical protein
MAVIIVLLLLSVGAVATFFLPPQHRTSHIVVSLVPVAALATLLLQLPLPDSLSISWSPAVLFPESLTFRAGPNAVAFGAYLCCLLILIEWTRPLRQSPGRSSRIAAFLLTISGIAACFASTPLAMIIVWSWIDFLSFLIILFLKSPVEIGPGGISSPLTQSMGILAVNLLGTILMLFSIFIGSSGPPFDWSAVGSSAPQSLPPLLFMTGIVFRLLLAPLLLSFPRIKTSSMGSEVLLRIVSPAAVLCFLSNVWPSLTVFSTGNPAGSWLIVLLSIVILAAGWQWCISSSPFARRDVFFLLLPGFALLSALCMPNASGIYPAAGALLILGGGCLLVYIGYLSHRRWMAAFLLILTLLLAGIPYSPMAVWTASVYPGLLASSGFPSLLVLIVCHVFILCALCRTAFEPIEEFPSNEPLFLFTFSLGMGVSLMMLLYPGWSGVTSIASVVAPVLLLLAGILLAYLFGRYRRAGTSLFLFMEKFLRLDWMQRGMTVLFQQIVVLLSGVESFLSGEGAMLWSLGIALLLYLVVRGG